MKNRLRDERNKMQLTQAELAEKVNVSRQTIISVETGRYIPSVILAMKLANVLGRQVELLFQLEDND